VAEFEQILGQDDSVRRLVVTPEFWKEEQQEGARAFLEKRKPDFSRFRKRRA
jgi:2-ketocyclohexanecarboxyl-CoA hydrolase